MITSLLKLVTSLDNKSINAAQLYEFTSLCQGTGTCIHSYCENDIEQNRTFISFTANRYWLGSTS